MNQPILFGLGRIVATPACLRLLEENNTNAAEYLMRHVTGDFGAMCEEDIQANWDAIKYGSRVFSSYFLQDESKIWVITEADRKSTALILPSEY